MKSYSQQIREIWGNAPAPIAKHSIADTSCGTIKLSLSQRLSIAAMGLQRQPKSVNNLELTLADGSGISIHSTGEEIAVGDGVSIDGNPAPSGDYRVKGFPDDGKILVVTDGRVSEIKLDPKFSAIQAVRRKAGIKATPRVGKTEAEQRALAISAARRRVGLQS